MISKAAKATYIETALNGFSWDEMRKNTKICSKHAQDS